MTLAAVLVTCTMTMAQAQGRLKGKITDDTGETVPFANVIVEKAEHKWEVLLLTLTVIMTSTRSLRERTP